MDVKVEYLKIAFAFAGALLGAVIGAPVVEWFKDHLGARRQWITQRNEIIANIRLILGALEAFCELRRDAFGWRHEAPAFSIRGFERLKMFDFKIVNETLFKLSALQPEDSSKSAVGQRLVQYLMITELRFKQLQNIRPLSAKEIPDGTTHFIISSEDAELVKESDKAFDDVKIFLGGIHAPRLGIDTLSLLMDQDVVKFERSMQELRVKHAFEELEHRKKVFENQKRASESPAGLGHNTPTAP